MIASFPPRRSRLVLRVWNGEASVFLGWRPVSCTRRDPAAASAAAKGPSPGVDDSVCPFRHPLRRATLQASDEAASFSRLGPRSASDSRGP